eukprot:9552674-Prorocentrum_lima.AAC.1
MPQPPRQRARDHLPVAPGCSSEQHTRPTPMPPAATAHAAMGAASRAPVSYTHLRAHETRRHL